MKILIKPSLQPIINLKNTPVGTWWQNTNSDISNKEIYYRNAPKQFICFAPNVYDKINVVDILEDNIYVDVIPFTSSFEIQP